MILFIRWRLDDVTDPALERLEWADRWAMGLEAATMIAFALSLGRYAGPTLTRWPGLLIPAFVVPVGLVLPWIVQRAWGLRGAVASPCSCSSQDSRCGRRWSRSPSPGS